MIHPQHDEVVVTSAPASGMTEPSAGEGSDRVMDADQAVPGTEINASNERPSNEETDQASIPLESVDAGARSSDDGSAPRANETQQQNNSAANCEIQQESIKHALQEIISEIDREMEADFANEEVSRLSISCPVIKGSSATGAHAPRTPVEELHFRATRFYTAAGRVESDAIESGQGPLKRVLSALEQVEDGASAADRQVGADESALLINSAQVNCQSTQ